jgi:hypothetical protein
VAALFYKFTYADQAIAILNVDFPAPIAKCGNHRR